jgi:hypothetical protein
MLVSVKYCPCCGRKGVLTQVVTIHLSNLSFSTPQLSEISTRKQLREERHLLDLLRDPHTVE